MSASSTILAEFDSESAATRRVLARLPDAHFGYRPHAKSMDAGSLASHIASMLHWGVAVLRESSFDIAPGGEMRPAARYENQQALLAAYDANAASFHAALAGCDDVALVQPWALKMNGNVLFEMSRIAVLRSLILNHTVHHRAQLCVYLRLLDVPVPSVYGPSADEA